MKSIRIVFITAASLLACNTPTVNKTPKTLPLGVSEGIVEEVLQTSQYTYLHVKESNRKKWLAVNKLPAAKGETYYYKGGLLMPQFESKELQRKFDSIYFLDNISNNPESLPVENGQVKTTVVAPGGHETQAMQEVPSLPKDLANPSTGAAPAASNAAGSAAASLPPNHGVSSQGSAIPIEREKITIKQNPGDLTVAQILERKEQLNGKTIKLKGKITKVNNGIMQRNWLHLQDGTSFGSKFDLTITSPQELKIGEIVTVEGLVAINKDFGYGYFYDILVENAKISK